MLTGNSKKNSNKKWPDKADKVYRLYHDLPINFCSSTSDELGLLRDKKDIPVLSDAIFNHADVIISGDKDFLDAEIENPLVFSPKMFLDYLTSKIT